MSIIDLELIFIYDSCRKIAFQSDTDIESVLWKYLKIIVSAFWYKFLLLLRSLFAFSFSVWNFVKLFITFFLQGTSFTYFCNAWPLEQKCVHDVKRYVACTKSNKYLWARWRKTTKENGNRNKVVRQTQPQWNRTSNNPSDRFCCVSVLVHEENRGWLIIESSINIQINIKGSALLCARAAKVRGEEWTLLLREAYSMANGWKVGGIHIYKRIFVSAPEERLWLLVIAQLTGCRIAGASLSMRHASVDEGRKKDLLTKAQGATHHNGNVVRQHVSQPVAGANAKKQKQKKNEMLITKTIKFKQRQTVGRHACRQQSLNQQQWNNTRNKTVLSQLLTVRYAAFLAA